MVMSGFLLMLIYATATGICILLGGLLARVERIRPMWLEHELRHSIIAFGGGVLVAAVALVLVPEGTELAGSAWASVLFFLLGGFLFFLIDAYLGKRHAESPNLFALLLDYLPETLAMGGMFAAGAPSAPFLAMLIGLQNLPEGFNAYRELQARPGFSSIRVLWLMAALIPLGPLVGTLGWVYAADHPVFLGAVMLSAAGGILYLIFQDIAPQSRLNRHWAPTLGAVIGFAVGLLGNALISHG
jgi:ZIP family zinc transporter